MAELVVAYFVPKISVHIAGKRLKISPQQKKINPTESTKPQCLESTTVREKYAPTPRAQATAMVSQTPILSATHPKNGRAMPFMTLAKISAKASVVAAPMIGMSE